MTTALIVDDQPAFRAHLRRLLITGGLTVIGEAGDIAGAELLLIKHRPDLAIVDVKLPEVNGIEGTRRLKALSPGLRVILVSSYRDQAEVFKTAAKDAGAEQFMGKEELSLDVVEKWRSD